MVALHNLGQVYEALGDSKHVLDNYQRVLAIAEELGDREGIAFASGNLAGYHLASGDLRQALLLMMRSLRLHREIGNRFGERNALESLASVYRHQGNSSQARDYIQQANAIAEEIGDIRGAISGLSELGAIEAADGNTRQAISSLEEALRMARDKNFADDVRKVTVKLAGICDQAGENIRARHYRRLYHDCMQRIFNSEETRRVRQFITSFEQIRIQQQAEQFGLEPEQIAALTAIDVLADFDAIIPRDVSAEPGSFAAEIQHAVTIKTFGDLHVNVDGRTLTTSDWGRRKSRDLFKFLLIHHRRPVTLDEIMEKLWGGSSDRRTEMVVMNIVSRIRRAIEPERNPRDRQSVLTSNDRTYRLDLGEEADIDFLRFKELIVLARRADTAEERYNHYHRAIELYTDDFLKEDYYEEWTVSERDLLKDAFLEALEYNAGEEIRREEFEQAATTARRIIVSDSTSERGYTILITALAARGRRAEIRQVLAECIRNYETEFGTRPPSHLLNLADSLATVSVVE
jgi:two-component SAPR family response regulator